MKKQGVLGERSSMFNKVVHLLRLLLLLLPYPRLCVPRTVSTVVLPVASYPVRRDERSPSCVSQTKVQ